MRTIFLARSFDKTDDVLASRVDRLLASHNLRAVLGDNLGGEPLTPAVMDRIAKADGLIALLTRGEPLGPNRWISHPWVYNEIGHARALRKPTMALVEVGVDKGGAYGENEFIDLDRADQAEALVRLAQSIGEWKRKAGRLMKVQILPDDLAVSLVNVRGLTCHYRFVDNGEKTEPHAATLIGETGGTFIYVRGVQDEYMVEVEIQHPNRRCWISRATSQYLPVTLYPSE